MPSRNTPTAPKKVKNKAVGVVINLGKKVPKKKPEVHVNEMSSPEDILHASWEFISAFQFFNTFKAYFNLSETLSIEQLELALLAAGTEQVEDNEYLKRESSVFSQSGTSQPMPSFLPSFMVQIISPLLTLRQKTLINSDNYEQFIADVFPDYTNFQHMNILDKIKVLKSIEMAHVDIADPNLHKSSEALRFVPLGTDCEGWVYWYFGDCRLYREIPLLLGKNGPTMSNTREFTFELACSTIEQWKQMMDKLQSVKQRGNRDIAAAVATLGSEIIVELEDRVRHEAKMKKELVPQKRSRRLEVKFDEQVKRQKTLEQAETEELTRQKEAKQARLRRDQDRRKLQIAENRLRRELRTYITDLVAQGQQTDADMNPLKTLINSKTTESQQLAKMQGWIRILKDSISIKSDDEQGTTIQFVGESLDTAFDSILFKSTMRTYLVDLLSSKLNPISVAYEKAEQMLTDFLLDRYDDIDSFSHELNNTMTSIVDTTIRNDAVHLLAAVFSTDSLEKDDEVSQQEGRFNTKANELGGNVVHDIANNAMMTVDVDKQDNSNANSVDANELDNGITSPPLPICQH